MKTEIPKQQAYSDKGIRAWLVLGLIMIIIQIILGGITRLTGSGLSITEWDLVTGTLPPLNETDWQNAFDKYKQTEQFRQLNSGFTLPDFQFIFFWEWFHRLWGRLIGVAFAIPFIVFLIQKRFKKEMVLPLIILFLLGALQGAVGWIMVASGLTGDAVYVRPVKLGMHFILALVLLVYTYWFTLKFFIGEKSRIVHRALKNFTLLILVLLFFQLFYGALMAGYRAAPYAPTWPDINGSFFPKSLTGEGMEEINSILTTQFIHRTMAYVLVVLILFWSVRSFKTNSTPAFRQSRKWPLLFVLLQTFLGVMTIFTSPSISAYVWNEFEWMAILHQLTAIFLLLSLVHNYFLISKN